MPAPCTATTWLDVMPAIPLARWVPVVDLNPEAGEDDNVHGGMVGEDVARFVTEEIAYDEEERAAYLRVDLDDPQGFGYALRWYLLRDGHFPGVDQMVSDHMHGYPITDADRIALARALREVTP
jgi:hypothetical protein